MRHRLYGGVRGRCCNAPLYSIMLGYPVITAYYQVSVRLSLTLPSASFRQLLTKLTLPQLMDS
ncbi:hypothetical protein, partial [Candidatus Bandiella numerosa]|uniref:hypothetical protein n=1 Tax=Candidatus Bandiella numerosa TaxID=2570586 RepID=UPI001F253295